jgi:hypothetical protein
MGVVEMNVLANDPAGLGYCFKVVFVDFLRFSDPGLCPVAF